MRSVHSLALLSLSVLAACDETPAPTALSINQNSNPAMSVTHGRHPDRVWDLISTATAINDFVDVGTAGPTPGDIYVFVDDFVDKASGQHVGQAHGRCNLLDPILGTFECTGVIVFAHGTLTTAGILINAPGFTSVFSITGGTGIYRGATGEGSVELGGFAGPHDVQLRIAR